jgi:hypothetical protein
MSELFNNPPYTLYYAELPIDEDIQEFDFDCYGEFQKKVKSLMKDKTNDRVYLHTTEGQTKPILIHEDPNFILDALHNILEQRFYNDRVHFIQEYETYEDAFKVGLDMHETNALCYENNRLGNRKQN